MLWQPVCLQGLLSNSFIPNHFDPYAHTQHNGLVYKGGELESDWLLESYSKGIFPWFEERPYLWYSPPWRMVLDPKEFKISKSLKKFLKQHNYQIDFDKDFKRVVEHCAEAKRSYLEKGENRTWITNEMKVAYQKLFELGVGHSVEIRHEDKLVGGLYGICLGKFFFGESMFSLKTNTSKLALFSLCQFAIQEGFYGIDCQIFSDHLFSLGAKMIEKKKFLEQLFKSNQFPTLRGNWSLL